MPEIFLSYRRADAPASAGRLFDDLASRFGAAQVFRDVESIEAGENFEDAIRDALGGASVVLVVIGPHWIEARQDTSGEARQITSGEARQGASGGEQAGTRRLDDPLDYVRREIELALSLDTRVVPVLVENAPLPAAQALPPPIRELTKRNAVSLSHDRWSEDVEALLTQLERIGIAPVNPAASSQDAAMREILPALKGALIDFVPGLFALLRSPQRFLRRSAGGKVSDLTRAFAFFALSVLLAIALLVSGYTPSQPVVSFALTVFSLGLVVTVAISAPLWAAWRLVGATRHYGRVLTILLHQSAVLHLALNTVIWAMVVALDLRSLNVASDTIHEAMKPGRSFEAQLDVIMRAVEPLVDSGLVRLALALSLLVLCATLVWLISSWGAYRQTLGLSRARSAAAVLLFVVIVCGGALALGVLLDASAGSTLAVVPFASCAPCGAVACDARPLYLSKATKT